ncbi:unnamed protein product [Leuciscus chuanchicus]
MLGLMASASAVLRLGLLFMRPLQHWLKTRVPLRAWTSGRIRLRVTQNCVTALDPWKVTDWHQSGVDLGMVSKRKVVSTDASNSGWGALYEGRPVFGLWAAQEGRLHINCLEMKPAAHRQLSKSYSLFSYYFSALKNSVVYEPPLQEKKMQRKLTTRQAMEMILSEVNPCDSDGEDIELLPDSDSELSDLSSDEETAPQPKKRARLGTDLTETAKDGTVWREEQVGTRLPFTPIKAYAADGEPTAKARKSISSRLQSFLCFITLDMLHSIQEWTIQLFTSLSLAHKLLSRKTTILGTVNKIRREIPQSARQTDRNEFTTQVFSTTAATLTAYAPKRKKTVYILSSMHSVIQTENTTKRKPNTITLYNTTKCGVDVMDQMVREYTVRTGTRRWPVAVFYNMIDMAALNEHVLYQACTGRQERRVDFLLELARELANSHMCAKKARKEQLLRTQPSTPSPGKRAMCQVKHQCKNNHATVRCVHCYRYTCGKCRREIPWQCQDFPRADAASEYDPMADSGEEGSPLPGQRHDLAPAPILMGPACMGHQRVPADLPAGVLNTITQARAPSTRWLYASKWSVFSGWCSARNTDPQRCSVTEILSFLQELLDEGRSPSTLKVYVAAIAAFTKPMHGQSLGRNDLIIRFLRGARRLNPPRPPLVPVWDHSMVLDAMKGEPFEPLQSVDLYQNRY